MEIFTNTPIDNAIKIITQFPMTNYLTVMYNRSSKKDLYYLGIASFFIHEVYVIIKAKTQRLNEPPTIPFGLPFFGHSLYTLFMPARFLDWCNKNYGDVYNIYKFGRLVTYTSGKAANETVKAAKTDLSSAHGLIREIFHFHYVLSPNILEASHTLLPSIAKAVLARSKMPGFIPYVENGIYNARMELLGNDVNRINNPDMLFQKFVSFTIVPILLGEEFSSNRAVIESFGTFTSDIAKNIPIFVTLPVFLHQYILPYIHSHKMHIKIMETHVAPFISKYRETMRLARESGIEVESERTVLQEFIDCLDQDNETQYTDNEISQAALIMAFVSVHTTSVLLSHCVYWLLARPDLKDKLMEEIEEVAPGDTHIDTDTLNKMSFFNNFTREVLRQGTNLIGVDKIAMEDYTFDNGYQIPKGRLVGSSLRQLNFGHNLTRSKIDEMDPNMSGNIAATTPKKDFAVFSLGKHVCPGRFLAVQEVKMTLIYLLRNFDITTANGKRPQPTRRVASVRVVGGNEPLVFTVKNKINA